MSRGTAFQDFRAKYLTSARSDTNSMLTEVIEKLNEYEQWCQANMNNGRYTNNDRLFQESATLLYSVLTPYAQSLRQSIQAQLVSILRDLSQPEQTNGHYDLLEIVDTISTIKRILTY